MRQYQLKPGEEITVEWKTENGAAIGITRGTVVGVYRGEPSGDYLVLDSSTYQDSFKSNLLSLRILDLNVIPMTLAQKIKKIHARQRPRWSYERFKGWIWAHFRSNVDFETTWSKVRERTDCNPSKPPKPSKRAADAEYQIVIRDIEAIDGATVTVYSTGALMIKCKVDQLNDIVEWVSEVVGLWPDHKRLVLFQTSFKYAMWDTYKEGCFPADEIIDGIGKLEKGPSASIFNIGWSHHFFVEMPNNPLQKLLPELYPLDKFLVKQEDRKRGKSRRRSRR